MARPIDERLAEAETQEERSEIIKAWTQEEIDNKRDIFELFSCMTFFC